jgi:regulatory protein
MWLAQREHSRNEMRRKLLRRVRLDAAAVAAQSDAPGDDSPADVQAAQTSNEVEQLLDWLEANNYLSQARFVESRLNARAARFGNLRIRQELARHAVVLSAERLQVLQQTELQRARAVWARKFGSAAGDAKARAKQMRFLAGRGFSPEVIRKVVTDAAAD